MMGQFLAPGSVFLRTEDRDGVREELRVGQELDRVDAGELPIVVLIDQGTSGEAEAVAAVLRESAGAVLIGTRTFGAGGGYEFVELEDGSAIYMATSRWSTPAGQLLDQEGVKPDFVVPYRAGGDGLTGESQFDSAYRHLNDLLPPFR
jgi:carboxyl-terminal processing protease